jgi:hypothetical protein
MEEGAMTQGKQMASGSQTDKETDFHLNFHKEPALPTS